MTQTAERKRTRRTPEERVKAHYLALAILIRQSRLYRLPAGVKRASFVQDGAQVSLYVSASYPGYGYLVTFGEQGYECTCEQFEHCHNGCKHSREENARAKAAYEMAEAQRVVTPEEYDDLADLIDETPEEHAAYRQKLVEQQAQGNPVAWVDPFAGMTKEEKREAYRNMYPDDFYSAA